MADSYQFYIAVEDYNVINEDGHQVNASVGDQFVLVEEIDDDNLRLRPLDSNDSHDENNIILPKRIMENMSKSSTSKSNRILRSHTSMKERICSLDLTDTGPEIVESCRFSTFGHVAARDAIASMTRSTYEPVRNRCTSFNQDLRTRQLNSKSEDFPELPPTVNLTRNNTVDNKWICKVENGEEVYVHADRGERWRATTDDGGRKYFYEENMRISLWNLPGEEKEGEPTFADVAVRPIDDVLEKVVESPDSEFSDSDSSDDFVEPISPPAVDESRNTGENLSSKFNVRNIKKEHISGPLFNKLMRTEKSGTVEKAKVSENGKDIPVKKWATFYLILTGPELLFYKDVKAAAPKPGLPSGKVDLKLKIQNLQFSEKPDPASKNGLMQIEDTGAPGSNITYLLRYQSPEEMRVWLVALDYAKKWQNEDRYSEKASKLVLTSDKRLIETGDTDETSNDKQNIKNLLRQFLKKRPTQESLEAKGILKPEAVFGSSLEILCDQEKNKVPEFVFRCILAIEARGLSHNGIYRISGNQAKIQKLRLSVDENKYQLNAEDIELETLTGAFKLFFKELKEPLLDDEFCNKMVDILADKRSDKKNPYKDINISQAKKIISRLKPSHYETAKALIGHLVKVVSLSNKNLMDVGNISMVWGPNLYHSTGQASTKLAVYLMTHNQIVDFLISQYSDLFDGSTKR